MLFVSLLIKCIVQILCKMFEIFLCLIILNSTCVFLFMHGFFLNLLCEKIVLNSFKSVWCISDACLKFDISCVIFVLALKFVYLLLYVIVG